MEERKERLYEVGMKNRKTGERLTLIVRGYDVDDATRRVTNGLFGYMGPYIWTGSGPHYEEKEGKGSGFND